MSRAASIMTYRKGKGWYWQQPKPLPIGTFMTKAEAIAEAERVERAKYGLPPVAKEANLRGLRS
jgi:hypothetical protein